MGAVFFNAIANVRYANTIKFLKGATLEDLEDFLKEPSLGKLGRSKANEILSSIEDTTIEFKKVRDEIVRSTIRQI